MSCVHFYNGKNGSKWKCRVPYLARIKAAQYVSLKNLTYDKRLANNIFIFWHSFYEDI